MVGELAQLVARSPDSELQARAAYALAECVNAYRAGPVWGGQMYARVLDGQFHLEDALEDASPESVDELARLRAVAQQYLIPWIEPPLHLGPTFDLTRPGPMQRLAGEGDLITDGLLIEIKSNMGLMNKRGERPDRLKAEHIFQLLGYALLDYSDTYRIERLGVFSARYGDLHEWPLGRALHVAAGGPVDLDELRETVWTLMQEEPTFI